MLHSNWCCCARSWSTVLMGWGNCVSPTVFWKTRLSSDQVSVLSPTLHVQSFLHIGMEYLVFDVACIIIRSCAVSQCGPPDLTPSLEFWDFIFQHCLDSQHSMAFQPRLRSYWSNPGASHFNKECLLFVNVFRNKDQDAAWLVAIKLSLFPGCLLTLSCPSKLFCKLSKLHFI